jgi:putative phosphotransacetylase
MGVVTEAMLRSKLVKGIASPFILTKDQILTPAAYDFLKARGIQTIVKDEILSFPSIPVGVSNRHVHLKTAHIQQLFGRETLTPLRELSQKGQYAAVETVTLIGSKNQLQHVRVLGPARQESQVEISRTDGYLLGVHPPIRLSGDINDTPGITLIGPTGSVTLDQGVIIAKRHVHMSPNDALTYGVHDGDSIRLRTSKTHGRSIVYADVIVRVHERYSLDFHLDLDEANAGNLITGDVVEWA